MKVWQEPQGTFSLRNPQFAPLNAGKAKWEFIFGPVALENSQKIFLGDIFHSLLIEPIDWVVHCKRILIALSAK